MNLRARVALSLTLVGAAVLLAGCGKNKYDATPVLATVNGENITQGQLDYARNQIMAAHPGASAPDNGLILKGLVEQRLLAQKAEKDKLDRNPGVLQALESARKEALVRFYLEQVRTKVPKPTPDEIKQFYDGHPQFFASRNIYTLQQVEARFAPDVAVATVAKEVQATGSAAEALALLKSKAAATNVSEGQRTPQSLGPLLGKIAQMKVGETFAFPQPNGLAAVTLVGVQAAPLSLEQATPAISTAIWLQRSNEKLQAEAKSLHDAAKIEFLGKFAQAASGAAPADAVVPAPPPVEAASEAASAASQ